MALTKVGRKTSQGAIAASGRGAAAVVDLWLGLAAGVGVVALVLGWADRPQGDVGALMSWLLSGAVWVAVVATVATAAVQVVLQRRRARARTKRTLEGKIRSSLLNVVGQEELARVRVSAWDGTSPVGCR